MRSRGREDKNGGRAQVLGDVDAQHQRSERSRCLEKRQEDRFSLAHDLAFALRAYSEGPRIPAMAKAPDIASAPVPEALAALDANPEAGLTRAEAAAHHAAVRAIAGTGFATVVTASIGRLLRLVAVG